MNNFPKRIVIYIKDIMLITGQSERSAHRLIKKIRAQYNRPCSLFVSVDDFCAFTGLKEEKVREFLQ